MRGRVQGVGFRDFVQRAAVRLAVTGYIFNLCDGSLIVFALWSPAAMAELEGLLHHGPRSADVRGVNAEDMPGQPFEEFRIVV